MGLFDNAPSDVSTARPVVAAAPRKSVFDLIGEAEGDRNSSYLLPGIYPVLQVNVLKMITARAGHDSFVAEFDILDSEVEERPAGTSASWVVAFKPGDREKLAANNVRSFLAALMGATLEEVDAKAAAFASSAANPCHGRLVHASAVNKLTKAGGDFTAINWRTLQADVQARAAELRLAARFPPF